MPRFGKKLIHSVLRYQIGDEFYNSQFLLLFFMLAWMIVVRVAIKVLIEDFPWFLEWVTNSHGIAMPHLTIYL